jgi:hypothetical protein
MLLTIRVVISHPPVDHWNDKITTFPGLYLLSAAAYALVPAPLQGGCSASFLRSLNLLLAAGIPAMAALCRQQVGPAAGSIALHVHVMWSLTSALILSCTHCALCSYSKGNSGTPLKWVSS